MSTHNGVENRRLGKVKFESLGHGEWGQEGSQITNPIKS